MTDVDALTADLTSAGVAGVTIHWADNNSVPRSRTVLRITGALGPDLLGAFLAVRRSDAAAAHDRALDDVLADLRWRY